MIYLYTIFSALWRRIYGEGTISGFLGNRGVQAVVFVLVMTLIYSITYTTTCILASLVLSIYFYAQFWSRAIGSTLDCGEATHQDKNSYSRWFRIPLDWVYDKLGKTKYVGMYDFWYMMLRYTLCMVPLCVMSPLYLLCGITAPVIYFSCRHLYRFYPVFRNFMLKFGVWFDDSKNLSEIIHGLIVGFICATVKWGWLTFLFA